MGHELLYFMHSPIVFVLLSYIILLLPTIRHVCMFPAFPYITSVLYLILVYEG
jgi:hypothetical protein